MLATYRWKHRSIASSLWFTTLQSLCHICKDVVQKHQCVLTKLVPAMPHPVVALRCGTTIKGQK